jgi:hypothetical protein
MVTAPSPDTYQEAQHFLKALKDNHFHFDGVILNRTIGPLKIHDTPAGFEAPFAVLKARQIREQQIIDKLLRHPTPICAKIAELARDIHSVEDLLHVAMALPSSSLSEP